MKNIIACLGYNPNNDGVMLPIMEERIKETIRLCRENPGSLAILSGGPTFRGGSTGDLSLAAKKYIEQNSEDILPNTEFVLTNEYTSTIRELCMLREMIDKQTEPSRLTIVASEFFVDRVKLYSEYIFENLDNIKFIGSQVPTEGMEGLREIEALKLQKGHEWLDGYRKGDYRKILGEQEAYEQKILRGEIDHPVSRPLK